MNTYAAPLALLLALLLPAVAQDRPRKSMTFQPGAKRPDGEAAAAAAAPPPRAAPAAERATADTPAQIVSRFFALVQKGEVDDAYTGLMKGSKIAERAEEVRQLKGKTEEAVRLFGTILGHELVENKTVGQNLLRSTYLTLAEEFPLRWRFYFYRSAGQWRLVDLRVDDRLVGMFEEEAEAPSAPPAAQAAPAVAEPKP